MWRPNLEANKAVWTSLVSLLAILPPGKHYSGKRVYVLLSDKVRSGVSSSSYTGSDKVGFVAYWGSISFLRSALGKRNFSFLCLSFKEYTGQEIEEMGDSSTDFDSEAFQ